MRVRVLLNHCRPGHRGFTLIELGVIIAVLGLVAAGAIPGVA